MIAIHFKTAKSQVMLSKRKKKKGKRQLTEKNTDCDAIYVKSSTGKLNRDGKNMTMLPYSVSSRSILITSILNSACDRLAIFFCLVLFLVFCSFLSFGLCFFVSSIWQPPCVCFCVLGRAALTPCKRHRSGSM